MTIEQIFGNILRTERKSAGLSQEALALRCNIDRTFISMLERGRRQPTLKTLFKLSDALNLKPSYIILKMEKYFSFDLSQ